MSLANWGRDTTGLHWQSFKEMMKPNMNILLSLKSPGEYSTNNDISAFSPITIIPDVVLSNLIP